MRCVDADSSILSDHARGDKIAESFLKEYAAPSHNGRTETD